jgi:predicted O-methyltransferase YrrM
MDHPPADYAEIAPILTEMQAQVTNLKYRVHDYMEQLHGWCSCEKADFLIDLILRARPSIVLEIGVWGGKSLIPMACALKHNGHGLIYGIDPWEIQASVEWVMEDANRNFWEHANHEWVYQHLLQKLTQFDLHPHVSLNRNTSEKASPIEGIDLLHIDGNHSDPASYLDVTKWVPLVKSGGWIIFDDMTWFEKGVFTTSRASQWLDANCYKIAEFTDICTWGVWVKP